MYPAPIHFENGSELRFRLATQDSLHSQKTGAPATELAVLIVGDSTESGSENDPQARVISRASVTEPNLPQLEDLLAALRATLRSGSVEIIHREEDREVAQSLAAMLIVTARVLKYPSAEYAIRSVTGRTELLPGDEPVLTFYRSRTGGADAPHAKGVISTDDEAGHVSRPLAETEAPLQEAGVIPSREPDEVLAPEDDSATPPKELLTADAPVAPPAPVTKPTPAPAAPTTETAKAAAEFQLSRVFTIRNKLLFITSAIITTAMVTLIVVTTIGFRRTVRIKVEENNFVQAGTLGSKADFEFQGIMSAAELLMAGGGAGALRENFFARNPRILFAGRAVRLPNSFTFTQKSYNEARLAADELPRSTVDTLFTLHGDRFLKAFNGASVVENISPGFPIPVLGIARPVGTGGDILIAVLDMRDFLKAFGAGDNAETGLRQAFLVNAAGEVLAHPDLKLVRARANLGTLDVVKKLLTAKVAQGQSDYTDKDQVTWTGSYKKLEFGDLGIVASARKDLIFKPVNDQVTNNIYLLVIAVNVALLTIFFFARALTVPIGRLVDATQLIEAGDYQVNIPPTTRDEVGLLTSSFVNMARGLGEREKMKDAFGKFVNKEIAERVLRGEVMLGGEKKHCAIFFSDLRGFTAMSEGLLPEQVVDFLNRYFTGMVRCVNNTHGIVDKFIGDAIMAHWGAVVSHGNDTENAVNAALMMRQTLIEFNRDRPPDTPLAKMGCGINTGDVIAGQIGSDERLEFTVIGDAVNLASRIEALNKPFGTDLLISSDSLQAVPDIYHVTEMPAIKVKGKSEPQRIYAVLGRKDDPDSPRDLKQVRAMVGIDWDDSKEPAASEGEEVKYEILDDKKK